MTEGQYVRSTREKANLSQGDIAKALGYASAQFVSNWERGISKIPIPKIHSFAKITQSSPEALADIKVKDFENFIYAWL